MKLKYFLSGALLAIVLFLAACSGNGEEEVEAESQGEEESGEVEKDDKNLVIAQASDLVTMDPQDSLSTTGDRFFRNLNNRLFKRNPDMEIVPDLVESSENIDEETWRFKLIEGVKFHNGEDLTAEDVKFSLERVMTDDSLKEYPYFTQLKEVNVIDDYELEVVTDGPMPTIQHVLAKVVLVSCPKIMLKKLEWKVLWNNRSVQALTNSWNGKLMIKSSWRETKTTLVMSLHGIL